MSWNNNLKLFASNLPWRNFIIQKSSYQKVVRNASHQNIILLCVFFSPLAVPYENQIQLKSLQGQKSVCSQITRIYFPSISHPSRKKERRCYGQHWLSCPQLWCKNCSLTTSILESFPLVQFFLLSTSIHEGHVYCNLCFVS